MADHIDSTDSLRLADLLAALSVTTDLGHGRPPEDAMHACLLATSLAQRAGLSAGETIAVYYTTLLRYVGCTAYAHEEAALFGGDEIDARAAIATLDMADPRDIATFVFLRLGRTQPPLQRAGAVASALPRVAAATKELAASNCEVGAGIARRLGLPLTVQTALLQLYERWDGRGQPRGMAGEDLAVPMRFAHVATLTIVFTQVAGIEHALQLVRERAGRDLDPSVVAILTDCGPPLVQDSLVDDVWPAAVAAEPEPQVMIPRARLDVLARTFGDMVDLKLPFTRGHSSGVAAIAAEAARSLRMSETDAEFVELAGLFHDLGRVAIPNGVWERRGRLSASDWERVRLHPYHTERILSRSPILAPVARPAGMHHERQDGSGYHRQAGGSAIPLSARVVAAADAYQAMTQERPQRPALSADQAAETLRADAGAGRLDGDAVNAVLTAAGHRISRRRVPRPGGLSEREVEVLRLIAGGESYKSVAQRLVISPRTAAHHIQHIYDKVGVSTRAAAAMFAMEHGLVG